MALNILKDLSLLVTETSQEVSQSLTVGASGLNVDLCGTKWGSREYLGPDVPRDEEGTPRMLVGTYEHSMDSKGRIVLPRAFAEFLGTGGYVTKGVDGCLSILSQHAFEAEAQDRLEESRSGGPAARKAARSFASSAAQFTLDKARRLPLPAELREFAQLEHQCVVIGNLDRIEIWDAAIWREIEAVGNETLTTPEGDS